MPWRWNLCSCRYKGKWSPYLSTKTWASKLGPALLFSIAWGGLLAIATVSPQHLQAYFNRLCFLTTNWTATVSSCSLISTPIWLKQDPQCWQDFSSSAKSWTISSRGKWGGKGLRPLCFLQTFFSFSSSSSSGSGKLAEISVRLLLATWMVFF